MEYVDMEKVDLYSAQFDKHDADNSGTLTYEDIDLIARDLRQQRPSENNLQHKNHDTSTSETPRPPPPPAAGE